MTPPRQRPYQDVLNPDGTVAVAGSRDCAGRWDAIEAFLLDHYHGTPTGLRVLDLGAYTGYFAVRTVTSFPGSTVVAVDNYRGLPAAVAAFPGIRVVARRVDPVEVRHNGPFDVTFALSVLHHIPDWVEMLDTLIDTTTGVLFIEPPNPDEVLPRAVAHTPELTAAVEALGGEPVAVTAGHRSDIPRTLWAVVP